MANRNDGDPGSSRPRRTRAAPGGPRQRPGGGVRGPTSALTDFLASQNISAADIRQNYLRRVAEAESQAESETGTPAQDAPIGTSRSRTRSAGKATATLKRARDDTDDDEDYEEDDDDDDETEDTLDSDVVSDPKGKTTKGRAARVQKKVSPRGKGKVTAKGKGNAKVMGKGKGKKGESDSSDDTSDDDESDASPLNFFAAKKKRPGQRTECETCKKMFTVSPYTVQGSKGGLLCAPCGKLQKKDDAKIQRAQKKSSVPRKRRQKFESAKLDGRSGIGVKSLQKMCLDLLVHHAADIEDFGDLNEGVWQSLSHIFTKNRALKPETMNLFVKPDLRTLEFQDCSYLETADYSKIITECPFIEKLTLSNASQFKDNNLDLLAEKAAHLTSLQLESANLVTSDGWIRFFKSCGHQLKVLKLKWLDNTLTDSVLAVMVEHCPNLERIKLSTCSAITVNGLVHLEKLDKLQHLSLDLPNLLDPSAIAPITSTEGSVPPPSRSSRTDPDSEPTDWRWTTNLINEEEFPWHKLDPSTTSASEWEAFRREIMNMRPREFRWNKDEDKAFRQPCRKMDSHGWTELSTDDEMYGDALDNENPTPEVPVSPIEIESSPTEQEITDTPTESPSKECYSVSSPEVITRIITKIGHHLETLSLASIPELVDDGVLDAIARNCHKLMKIRITDAEGITDEGLAPIFDRSLLSPPLKVANLSFRQVDMTGCRSWQSRQLGGSGPSTITTRAVPPPSDNTTPNDAAGTVSPRPVPVIGGQQFDPSTAGVRSRNGAAGVDEEIVVTPGFGSKSLEALMRISGRSLRNLNLSSCDSISYESFCRVFHLHTTLTSDTDDFASTVKPSTNGATESEFPYPELESLDLSFCPPVNSPIIQAVIDTCPNITKIVAIACFAAWNPNIVPQVAGKGKVVDENGNAEANANSTGPTSPEQKNLDRAKEIYRPQTIYVPRTCALIGPQEYSIVDDRVAAAIRADQNMVIGKNVGDLTFSQTDDRDGDVVMGDD